MLAEVAHAKKYFKKHTAEIFERFFKRVKSKSSEQSTISVRASTKRERTVPIMIAATQTANTLTLYIISSLTVTRHTK